MTHVSRDRPLRWAVGLRFGVVLAVWFVAATGLAVGAATPPDPGFDRYGGWRGISSSASGRFRVERISGVWWLITPEGNAFLTFDDYLLLPAGAPGRLALQAFLSDRYTG